MPAAGSAATAGSSFFGRFTGKKHPQEITSGGGPIFPTSDPPIPPPIPPPPPPAARSTTPPPTAAVRTPDPDNSPSKRLQKLHKRESSFTSSLTNSVQELGSNVKRSVSLRSHRTHGSGGSVSEQSRPVSRYQPVSKSPPILSPIEPTESISESLAREPPTPPRSRGRLALATRSLSQRFKSSEHLPISDSPEKAEGEPPTPPVPSLEEAKAAMLSTASTPGLRRPFERPSFPSQASSFTRDIGTSYAAIDGGAMQQASTFGASNVHNLIYETARKRIGTIEYMRKLHDGNVFFFNTLHYSMASLSQMPSLVQAKLGRRATNYMVLGHSLPAVLDMATGSPLEYLKALSALLQEYETYQTLSGYDSSGNSIGRGRMGQMFKSGMGLGGRTGKGRRSSTATDFAFDARANSSSLSVPLSASDTGSPQDMPSPINPTGHEFHYLLTPHLPFEPDFSTTFSTLCDMLIDVYGKLLDLLSSPEVCNQQVGDTFAKADKAVRKLLIASVVREFEDNTKSSVKGEVAGLGKLVLGGFV